MNIEEVLKDVESRMRSVLKGGSPFFSGLYRNARLDDGKRLRGRLFLIFSGSGNESSINIASALELLHAATLIHDDILDNSNLRRGKPSLYLQNNIPVSLLYGDYLFSSAFSLISRLKDPIINIEITRALSEVLKGEITEQNCRRNYSLTREKYFSIIEKKSGVLFASACKLGTYVKGMPDETVRKAYLFGLDVGIIYQIVDDCYDYFVKSKDKESFTDLKQGVVTLPLIYLLKKCRAGDKQALKKALGKGKETLKEAGKIVFLMRKHKVMEDISKDVNNLLRRAERLILNGFAGQFHDAFNVLSWLRKQITCVKN